MAKLSGPEIQKQVDAGRIIIDPFTPAHVSPNSVDLTLADRLVVYEDETLDMRRAPRTRMIRIPKRGIELEAGRLYLGVTNERAGSDHYVPGIEGRSSVARLGLAVHITAGFGDVGFKGRWTLEMVATKRIRIYAGVRICQVYFDTIEGELALRLYCGKYGSTGRDPGASKLYEDFENERSEEVSDLSSAV